ncbi:hypothetical protein GGR51DRAFT_499696 [Nemania sp. FL0031]|nr:hypothetical protein GGR51DRAFT_499696 [Nemania sp. FL0031]
MEFNKSPDERDERDSPLAGLALLPYHERLTKFIRGSTRHWVPGGVTVIDFRPLYTVTIHDLQNRLVKEIQKVNRSNITDKQLDEVRDTLAKYTDALRNFEFIHTNRWNTQFVKDIAASRLDDGKGSRLQGALIRENGLKVDSSHRSVFHDSDLLGTFDHKLMQQSTALGFSLGTGRAQQVDNERRRSKFRNTVARFSSAIIGGLIIVAPLLILVAHDATPKTLAVISTSILLFALGIALFSKAEPENLLAATAAYAAVLVTLIGTGNGGVQGAIR